MMKAAADAVLEHGSIAAGAKSLGLGRGAMQNRIDEAAKAGLIAPRVEANPSRWRPGAEIVAARKAEFARVAASNARDGNIIHRPDDGPFMVVVLGDPHLDASGCDLNLWEQWIGQLDRAKHRTAISLGDNLDNWPRVLAHLYGASETAAPEGWILLEHYLSQIGEDMDASIGGNHDTFSGYSDVLGMLMAKYGVMHRSHALRFTYRCPGGREITVNARHSWPGRSMYSAVHGIKRAAKFGIRDNILVGGHTHISGEAIEKDPSTGRLQFCYQVASFKIADDYAEQLGFLDGHISPAVALIIDPRHPDTSPELVKHFFDPAIAADYLKFLRRKA